MVLWPIRVRVLFELFYKSLLKIFLLSVILVGIHLLILKLEYQLWNL